LNISTEISTGIVSIVQLWAKETGIFGFRHYIIQKVSRNRVRKNWLYDRQIVSKTYLERFKPAGTKSKETPGEESPKILKSGFDWTKMLGRGGLIDQNR